MIDPALLERLQKADHETWQRFYDETVANIWYCDEIDKEGNDIEVYGCSLTEEATEAWLQHVLQCAIRAKGWQGIVLFSDDGSRAVINGPDTRFGYRQKLSECIGNSSAEALLRAYLAAIEAHEEEYQNV